MAFLVDFLLQNILTRLSDVTKAKKKEKSKNRDPNFLPFFFWQCMNLQGVLKE